MQIFEGQMRTPDEGDIVIVVAKFNRTITDRLLEGALAKLRESHVDEQNIIVCRVPGAFELPIVAGRFTDLDRVACVICLGAVIRGETSHDEHINRAVSLELAKIATDSGKPVIFGLLTCNTVDQAIARSGGAAVTHDKAVGKDAYVGNKGYEAAEAALEMINLLSRLPQSDDADPFGALADMFARTMMGAGDSDGLYDTPFEFDDDDDDDDFDDRTLTFFPRKKAAKKRAGKSAKKAAKKSFRKPSKKSNKKRKGK